MEWRAKFDTHFEGRHVHSLHSPGGITFNMQCQPSIEGRPTPTAGPLKTDAFRPHVTLAPSDRTTGRSKH